ncbi:MAG: Hint domain-containing protein [Sulfitobacter sp.]
MIRTIDFNALSKGDVVTDQFADLGVTISVQANGSGVDKALIFDTNHPTGEDFDLATNNLDNVLIISEDGDTSDPDDNAAGGKITFNFADEVEIKSITLLDIEETATLRFFDAHGNLISKQHVAATEDNGQVVVDLAVSGAVRFEVTLAGSGAIDDLVFIDNVQDDVAPVAVDDMAETPEDTAVTIAVLMNDSDENGDMLTVTAATSDDGVVEINDDGTITFTPAQDFNGPTTITYTIEDPAGNQDTAVVNVNVTPVNDAPVAIDDAATTPAETLVTINVLGNDIDVDGDTLSVAAATSDDGEVVINDDGTLGFTPNPDFFGEATINYTLSDGELTDEGVVLVTVRDGIVTGTSGNDLIDVNFTGDPEGDLVDNMDEFLEGEGPNDDIINAGAGDDTILAGEGDDEVNAGAGSDVVDGGAGDDVINTGNGSLLPDRGVPGLFPDDPDPENDRDSVDGGDGNDTISTGDDRDTINGGSGDDVIDGGIDDDSIDGGSGDDRIVGGEGSDRIWGGAGNDTIFAGNDPDVVPDGLDIEDDGSNPFGRDPRPDNGRDLVDGGAGDDVIFGADDRDTLLGGTGNDFLDGGIDNDRLFGGSGNDTLIGGQGRDFLDGGQGNDLIDGGSGIDTLTGGADRDTFVNVGAGDRVDGSESGDDFDRLDLTGSAPEGGSLRVTLDDDNVENGVVDFFNADGSTAGQLVFSNIEEVVPCFTPGTLIATPQGERKVEDLQVGDRIITRDNGMQEIRWTGRREMSGEELVAKEHLRPVLIQSGALGNGLPERDMMVSPQHRVLIANDQTALYFEEREVLVAAKHLTDMEGIDVVDVSATSYIHLMFDRHEVILSDGVWTESFQPGDMSIAGVGDAARDELLELFPELGTTAGIEAYASARKSLKMYEAKLVTRKA